MSRIEAARRLGVPLCHGCLSLDCFGCKRSRLVGWITSGDDAAATEPARLWIERMATGGFKLEKNAGRACFATVAKATRQKPRPLLPHDDHPMMWRKPRVGTLYTSQPYMDWEGAPKRECLADMNKICVSHGLKMITSDELSWWFPKRTTLVIIGTDDVLVAAGFSASARSS